MALLVNVIIPAHNEEAVLPACLASLIKERGDLGDTEHLNIIIAANACQDKTVAIAQEFQRSVAPLHKISVTVLDLTHPGKGSALDAGDEVARGDIRIYLDADVQIEHGMIRALVDALDVPEPRYASGLIKPESNGDRAAGLYARIWSQLPFVSSDVPGCGLYAVNRAGRDRWSTFPSIHSDDKFVRLHFAPEERVSVPVFYHWPVPEGLRNLIRVRSRWCRGNTELARAHPELATNDNSRKTSLNDAMRIGFANPFASICFGFIYAAAKFRAQFFFDSQTVRWERGRL